MVVLVFRAIVVYSVVLTVYRFMGKRQIGQMQPFELVLTLIIADLATLPMAESTVPVLHGIIPLLTLVIMHYFLTILSRKSDWFNKLVSGKPVIVINPDGIDYKVLKQLNISVDDLFESIRGCGYFSLDEVQFAIVETNGTVNVLPKAEYAPAIASDVKKDFDITTIPVTLISEGSVEKENLKVAQVSEKYLKELLSIFKAKSVKDVLVLTIDSNGKAYFQSKKGKFEIAQTNHKKPMEATE